MRRLFPSGLLILSALAANLVCSCSQTISSRDEEETNERAMQFHVANNATKAVVSEDLFRQKGTTFGVWGTYKAITGSNIISKLFDGTEVRYNGTAWEYDDLQYWLPGFTYNFRAVYPKETAAVFEDGIMSIAGFDATSGTDLLLAAPAPINCLSYKKMPPVSFTFRHLLSRVVFVGRSDEKLLGKGRRIVVEEAKLYGIHTGGNWSEANASAPWTVTSTAVTSENTPYLINQTSYPDGLTLTPEGTDLFTHELFIPQDLTAAKLTIKFHYNVENGTAKTFTTTTDLSTLLPKWEAGKSYRYPFAIGSHIFFETPKLESWEYAPVNGTDFNIDHLQD